MNCSAASVVVVFYSYNQIFEYKSNYAQTLRCFISYIFCLDSLENSANVACEVILSHFTKSKM